MCLKQLIFRRTFTEKLAVPVSSGAYLLYWTVGDVLRHARLLLQTLGIGGSLKATAKIMTGKRKFFLVAEKGCGQHWGWVSISFCRPYPIRIGEVVIGPIETIPQARGKGYATFALAQTVNALLDKGFPTIFIDTEETNHSCLKVIAKCQFGDPVNFYNKNNNPRVEA